MTLKYFNVKNGLSTGNIILHSGNSNVVANTFIGNLSVTGLANLGNVENIRVAGGSSGQVLSTDGSGNLSWITSTGGGNVTLQLPDVSVDTFTADGSNNSFTLTKTPENKDYVFVNVDGVFQFRDSFTITGNVLAFGSTPLQDSVIEISVMVPGQANNSGSGASANTIFNGNSNVKVYANSDVTISSNGTPNVVSVSSTDITITANLIPSANVTYNLGSPSNSFKDLYLSGSTIYFGGATIKTDATTGAIALIPTPTVAVPNPTGLVITTSGTISTVSTSNGNVTTNDLSNAVANSATITVGGANTQIQFNDDGDFGASSNLTFNKSTSTLTATHLAGEGGNISNIAVANITGLGNISTVNLNGNANTVLYGNGVFAAASGGGASVTVASAPPVSPTSGSLWYDNTTTGELYVYSGNTWVTTSIMPITNVNDPVVSGPTQANEVSTQTFTITNYNASFAYVIAVTGGTFTRSAGTISWTMPAVTSNTSHYMTTQVVSGGVTSSIDTRTVLVVNLNIDDTAVVVTDFSYNSYNSGWTI